MRIIFVAPHLSTGGLPQYLYKKVELLTPSHDVYVIEHSNHSDHFVVQKNKLRDLLGNKFISIGSDKMEIFKEIQRIKPDVVHLEEIPEYFLELPVAESIYSVDRNYKIFETSHDSSYNIECKVFLPDAFLLVSPFQIENFKKLGVYCHLVEYPIEYVEKKIPRQQALEKLGLDPNFKHVINVGLFTPRKNQAEVIEYARSLQDQPIKFHFIGNQADNFESYWKPLMENLPGNCVIWGERNDVANFYEAADLFLFTSRGTANDKETSPLVIREAISWKVPSLIYNLPVYLGMYDNFSTIKFLQPDFEQNKKLILESLDLLQPKKEESFSDKKIFIIDTFAKTEDKKNLLVDCINSVKKFGYDIMLVSHCTLPESIISMVNYHLYDAENTFNNNHVFGYTRKNGTEVRKFIHKSHEWPIVRAMRLALGAAKQMGYESFFLTEFDHVYSDQDIEEIKRLEKRIADEHKNFLFFRPPYAQFGEIVDQYFETCFFGGKVNIFLEKFESFFPQTLEDYNKNLAIRFPNCLEHFFWNIFKDEETVLVEEYVKDYFSNSKINVSSYQDTDLKILLDQAENPYLVIHNNNHEEFKYLIKMDSSEFEVALEGDLEFFPVKGESIEIEEVRGGSECKRYLLSYSKEDHEIYKRDGAIIMEESLIKKQNMSGPEKNVWTTNKRGEIIQRNLEKENENFSLEGYYRGEFDSYNYLWFEMFNHYVYDDLGCDYERYGCYIQPGDVVLDLGANIGLFSRRAEERGASKVISFEPVLPTFNCLLLNKGEKTEIYNMGVASVNEFRKFVIHTDLSNTGGGKFDPQNTLSGFDIVYEKDSFVVDINYIFSHYRGIDFMKVDIEGSEVEVLNAISEENLSSLRCLAAEFHSNSQDFEHFQSSFLSRLGRLGFSHFILYHGDGRTRTLTAWKKN